MRSLLSCCVLMAFSLCHAETMSLDIESNYHMSDNDSLSLGRNNCITNAKKEAIGISDSFVQTTLSVNNTEDNNGIVYTRTDQATKSITAGLVSAKVLEENPVLENNHMVFYCTVHVEFDPDSMRDKLKILLDNERLQKQLTSQGQVLTDLKKQVDTLKNKPVVAPQPVYPVPPAPVNVTYVYPNNTNVALPRIPARCVLNRNYLIYTANGPVWYTCMP